jgi:excisionase family DNA binding protein
MPEDITNSNNQYLTPEDVACYMKISVKTVYHWCSTGYLPSIKFGHLVRIDKNELLSRIEQIKNQPKIS